VTAPPPRAGLLDRADPTALLCLVVFANTFGVGAFGPLLPDIARTEALTDAQIGIVAGAFGFARTVADIPAGLLAGRRLGTTLAAAPLILLLGVLLLAGGGSLGVLVLGRLLIGLAHTLGMVGGLTAILRDPRAGSAAFRLNIFEFAGMLGILGGLGAVAVLPERWSWNVTLLAACAPQVLVLVALPAIRRRFPDQPAVPRRSGPAAAGSPRPGAAAAHPVVWLMFGVGTVVALSWSSVSQFLIPLRGTREFGLDRGGVSAVLAVAQVVDLLVLLPVGRLADRVGRLPVLGAVVTALGIGTACVGVGPFPLFVAGAVLFGVGLAGWMLPLGVVREHTPPEQLAWRTGFYRVGVDAAIFLGPVVSGLLGEALAGRFVSLVGVAALGAGLVLLGRRGP
jgi:MFS family permease